MFFIRQGYLALNLTCGSTVSYLILYSEYLLVFLEELGGDSTLHSNISVFFLYLLGLHLTTTSSDGKR